MDEVFEVATPGKLNYPLLNTDEEIFIVIEIKGCAVELYSGCLYSLRSTVHISQLAFIRVNHLLFTAWLEKE